MVTGNALPDPNLWYPLGVLSLARLRPRFFYGWVVVGAAFVSHFINYGVLVVSFGIFFPSMAASLGWGRGLLASVTFVSRVASAAGAPVVGRAIDRQGPRLYVMLGGAAVALGAAFISLTTQPWQMFAAYGVLMAVGGLALGPLSADSTVARWFVRKRGRALAFSTMGMSSAGVLLPIPLTLLIAWLTWRGAWLALGAFVLTLALAVGPLMRKRPEDYGMMPDGEDGADDGGRGGRSAASEVSLTARQAMRTPAFWLLLVSTNFAGFAISGVNLHIFSHLTDQQIEPGQAAAVMTYLYFLQSVAKPMWGFVAERLHVRFCLAACYAGGAAGIVLLMGASSLAQLAAFATVYGLTRGAQSFVSSLAWSDYFGREAIGAVRGWSQLFGLVSSAIGPVLGGLLYDVSGSYTLAFGVFVGAFALSSLAALLAQPPVGGRRPSPS